jgi:hypothetical protein
MADEKPTVEGEKKKEGDAGGTSFTPKATPPVDPKTGEDLPPGQDALEAQRKGFENAEKEAKEDAKEGGPKEREGVEADFKAAEADPSGSGHETKEDVKKQEEEFKKEAVKSDKLQTKGKAK